VIVELFPDRKDEGAQLPWRNLFREMAASHQTIQRSTVARPGIFEPVAWQSLSLHLYFWTVRGWEDVRERRQRLRLCDVRRKTVNIWRLRSRSRTTRAHAMLPGPQTNLASFVITSLSPSRLRVGSSIRSDWWRLGKRPSWHPRVWKTQRGSPCKHCSSTSKNPQG